MQKLLLADDSVTIQRVIELTFSGEDIQVIAVNDGEQAIARIPAEQPDIVLADIGMPKKGGYDVAAFVKGRADLEHIPVLLLAGAFEPVDQARAEQVRCDGVLIKPFEPRQVVERVRELLEGVKGSPARATADVARPVERLAPRAADIHVVPVVTVSAPVEASTPVEAVPPPAGEPPPTAVPTLDADTSLDDYFESLNVAFSGVGHAASAGEDAPAAAAPVPAAPTQDAPAGSTAGHAAARALAGEPHADAPAAARPARDEFEMESEEWPARPRRRGDSLDDYFDRLSSAFDQTKPHTVAHELPDRFDELMEASHGTGSFGSASTSYGSEPHTPAVALADGPAPQEGRSAIVDALAAMLSAPSPVEPSPVRPAAPPPPAALVGDDLADDVTRRVLDRLVPEVAESLRRLVQEEIERSRRR